MTDKPAAERRIADIKCGRRNQCLLLEESVMEEIAEKAAARAIEKLTSHVYQEIGRGFVSKLLWLAGVVSVGLWLWLNSKGWLK